MKTLPEFDQFLQSTVLKTKFGMDGWNLKIRDISIACGSSTFVYVYDHPSRWTWMAAIPREVFSKIAGIGEALSPVESELARGGLMAAAAVLESSDTSKTVEAERWLGISLALYAGGTRTYRSADRFVSGGHFCVILYRSPSKRSITTIRPFAVPAQRSEPLNVHQLLGNVECVLEHDRQRNPQWLS